MPTTASAARGAARATAPSPSAPAARATAPRLTVVARPQPRRSPVPFALLCTLIIVGTLVAVLSLNISMSDTSYEMTRLQVQANRLDEEHQSLVEENERLSTPQELEQRARSIGMVPAPAPGYVDLASGTVIGDPVAAPGTAAAPVAPAVPVARIYDATEPYHGMGNGGN
ncbi:hypothetical protein [Brachybacterium huguangmaarense]